MHLPFMQVANEVMDFTAPDVAALLDWDEDKACVGLIRLFRWALARCPEHEPPSANDVVSGPVAAKLIARAAHFKGDADTFVDACVQSSHPVLERVEGGIRVRGLDRYDGAWAAAAARAERAKRAAERRWAKEHAQPMPERCLGDAQTMPDACSDDARAVLQDAQKQTHTQIQTQKDSKATAAGEQPPPPLVVEYQEPATEPAVWGAEDFFAWAQSVRQEGGYLGEVRPRGLGSWYSEALMALGGDVELLQESFHRFGEASYWETQTPPFPFRGFMKQWRDYVPRREAEHASA